MPGVTIFELYQDQQDVEYTDLNTDNIAPINLMAAFIAALTNTNNMSTATPLAIVLSGSARSLIIGGTGQSVIVQGYLADSCAAATLAIAPNTSGSIRTDLIQVQYVQAQGNPHSAGFYGGGGGTVYSGYQTAAYQIKTNSTTPDSGWVAFAHLSVPIGFTVGTACTVTYLFPTLSSQLISGGIVQSINSHSGALILNQGTGVTINYSAGTFTISAPGAGVSSFNSKTGDLSLVNGHGSTVRSVNSTEIAVDVVAPLGATYAAFRTFTNTASSLTATLPTLPGDGTYTYLVEAYCHGFGLDTGNSAQVAGSGCAWPGTPATVDNLAYSRMLVLAGTATGGQTPSVVFSSSEDKMLEGGGTGYLVIKATRLS